MTAAELQAQHREACKVACEWCRDGIGWLGTVHDCPYPSNVQPCTAPTFESFAAARIGELEAKLAKKAVDLRTVIRIATERESQIVLLETELTAAREALAKRAADTADLDWLSAQQKKHFALRPDCIPANNWTGSAGIRIEPTGLISITSIGDKDARYELREAIRAVRPEKRTT